MPDLRETCTCGASLSIPADRYSVFTQQVILFREAHVLCRAPRRQEPAELLELPTYVQNITGSGVLNPPETPDITRLYYDGLRVIAAGGCENYTTGDCWQRGRTADAAYGGERACFPCIAARVLSAQTLPVQTFTGR